jgi:hypothetical protein
MSIDVACANFLCRMMGGVAIRVLQTMTLWSNDGRWWQVDRFDQNRQRKLVLTTERSSLLGTAEQHSKSIASYCHNHTLLSCASLPSQRCGQVSMLFVLVSTECVPLPVRHRHYLVAQLPKLPPLELCSTSRRAVACPLCTGPIHLLGASATLSKRMITVRSVAIPH